MRQLHVRVGLLWCAGHDTMASDMRGSAPFYRCESIFSLDDHAIGFRYGLVLIVLGASAEARRSSIF
jgi:hypothetical protein